MTTLLDHISNCSSCAERFNNNNPESGTDDDTNPLCEDCLFEYKKLKSQAEEFGYVLVRKEDLERLYKKAGLTWLGKQTI